MPKSLTQFRREVEEIKRQRLAVPYYSDIVEYATARNKFKQEQLLTLIKLASQNLHLPEAISRKDLWERRLATLQSSMERLEKNPVEA